MKKTILIGMVAGLTLGGSAAWLGRAQDKPALKYEYAILKWDGPDRLYYNLPDRFELVHAEKAGIKLAREAQDEEFFLTAGCNKLAREGWEPINLNSRRILLRRPVNR